jgi:hypothetical protein
LAENIDNIDIDEDDQSGDAEGLIDSSSFIFLPTFTSESSQHNPFNK